MVRLWWSRLSSTTDDDDKNGRKQSLSKKTSTTPLRPRTSSRESHEVLHSPRRRINSRDIPRTYEGLYGAGTDDLLPFEINRQHSALTSPSIWFLLGTYLTLVGALETGAMILFSAYSWTVTNAVHLGLTLVYIHWLKGSLYDSQGEMSALTVWEQLEATSDSRPVRQLLLVVPTALTYIACHAADYDPVVCIINVLLWMVAILAKLPVMNGVRIFGINRTVGIDDLEEEPNTGAGSLEGEDGGMTPKSSNVAHKKLQ